MANYIYNLHMDYCILFFIISKTKIIYLFSTSILFLFITFSSNKIDSKKYASFSQNVTVKSAPTENGTNLFLSIWVLKLRLLMKLNG